MPSVVRHTDESVIPDVVETTRVLSRTANAKAINPLLSTLPAVSRRLNGAESLREYLRLIARLANEAGDGLVPLFDNIRNQLDSLSIGGLANWIDAGIRACRTQPHRLGDWFTLQGQDSRAAMMRERHGTLYIDHERNLKLYLRAFWNIETECRPYSLAFDIIRRKTPWYDSKGCHIPDVYDDLDDIRGLDRYRALLAHMAGHLAWSKAWIADNYNRFQHLFIEVYEDSRIERLAMQRYPGLKRLWKALHPVPAPDACPAGWSSVRHKAAMLSRALLDPADHPYTDPQLLDFVRQFDERFARDPHDIGIAIDLGVATVLAWHGPDFHLPKVWFKDTEVGYRDDNRHLWIFLEDTEDEDDFHSEHAAANPHAIEDEDGPMFVRHLQEWDYGEQRHKPDWVSVLESIPPSGDPRFVDALLEKHQALARRLKHIVDLLKPQQHVRIRYQEDGDELDLDVALRAMVDYRSGITPDPRIHMSHETAGRDIAVLLLLDLSQSINGKPEGCESTILQLAQEAVSLLAWAIDAFADPFAIHGFASNTRHEVHYLHLKGFGERWGDEAKARIAALSGSLSTRMGAAVRNAGHYLGRRHNQKKLLLVLTDGEPHDVDVDDARYLREDTKMAVEELRAQGIFSYCITLDPRADDYVVDIFGPNQYTVIDRIERLPERLPQLFMTLTK